MYLPWKKNEVLFVGSKNVWSEDLRFFTIFPMKNQKSLYKIITDMYGTISTTIILFPIKEIFFFVPLKYFSTLYSVFKI